MKLIGRIKKSLLLQFSVFVTGILLILMLAFFITQAAAKENLKQNTLISAEKIIGQIEGKITDFYIDINHMQTALSYSPTVAEYYRGAPLQRVILRADVLSVCSNTMMMQSDIQGISLYNMEGGRIISAGQVFDPDSAEIVKRASIDDICHIENEKLPYYTIRYPIFDLKSASLNQKGMCIFILQTGNYEGYLREVQITSGTQMYLLDGNRKVLASSGPGAAREDLPESERRTDSETFVIEKKIGQSGWSLVCRIPKEELAGDTKLLQNIVIITFIITLLLFLFLIYFCYSAFIRPLRRLSGLAKEITVNPDMRIEKKRDNEIGELVQSLNSMLDERDKMNRRIQESQEKMYRMELTEKQMEILAYRNQINPHFLYNTFECIRGIAMYHDVDEIADIAMALSKVFRFAIKGDNWVTVKEELDYVGEYAKIIRYRFAGKIRIEFQIEEEVLKETMIKLILQPIVENAIFHGLEKKVGGGTVRIAVRNSEQGGLTLTVEDDGCGIKEEEIRELCIRMANSRINSEESRKSIGVVNVYQRLKLFYGAEATMQIESKYGEGTRVRIMAPAHLGKGETKDVSDTSCGR